jgi:hypothetical protein
MWVAVYTAAEPSPLFFKQVRVRVRRLRRSTAVPFAILYAQACCLL